MFLLLCDEFKLDEKASLIGALFFASIPIFLPWSITIAGIPLLFWALERVFDSAYSFKRRLAIYLYTLIYFFANSFVIIAFALLPFYLTYFLFFSKIKRNVKNIVVLCLIWGLYFLINLPVLTELAYHAADGHRVSWYFFSGVSWTDAARNLMTQGITTLLTLSTLGLLIVAYYVISSKKANRDKNFYFPMIWLVFIMLFAFFICKTPLWQMVKMNLGIFGSVQFDRFYLLLVIFFSILIGQASDFLIKKRDFSNKKAWIISAILIAGCICVGLKWNQFMKIQFALGFASIAIFLFLAWLRATKRMKISVFLVLLVPFLVFALGQTAYSRVQYGVHNYYHWFNSDQIEEVKKIEKGDIGSFRVVKVGGDPSQLLNNGFKCADGYTSMYPQAYKEFWAKVIEPELAISEKHRKYFLGWGNRAYLFDSVNKGQTVDILNFNIDLLKLINVKYLFSDRKITDYAKYGLIEIDEKDPDYFKTPRWKRYFKKGEFYVYQNKEYAPPVFLTGSTRIFNTKEELLDELGNRKYGYFKRHTLALKKDLEDVSMEDLNAAGSGIINYRLTPDMVEIEINNRYPVILNWTRNYDRNWRCEADGKELKIFPVYNSFMGVIVPPNSNEVKFIYRDVYLQYACLISLLGFLVANVFIINRFRNIKN
jgi:hypothetical protein